MSAYAGLDPEQMDASAHELRLALARVADVLDDVAVAESFAEVADLTAGGRALIGELQEELLLTVALLETRADLMRVVDLPDRWAVNLAGPGLDARQVSYGDGLVASLADRAGSDGAGDEVRRHLERRTWQLAGYESDPLAQVGPYDPAAVDRHFAALLASLRPSERMQVRAAVHQRFRSATTDGDPARLRVATTMATLIVDARVPASAGRYWTTLTASEREALLDEAPELLLATARAAVIDGNDLDTLDTANAYDVFSEELRAEFGLAVDVRYFTVELGGDVVASFTKLSDGSVLVEVGAGVDAGAGLGDADAKVSVGLYMERSYSLLFDSEADTAAAIAEVRAAIGRDLETGIVEMGARGLSFVSRLLPNLPDFHHRVESAALDTIGDLWDEYGVERTDEAGVYVELAGRLDDVGLLALEAEAGVRLGWYRTRDPHGNGREEGAVFRVEADADGRSLATGAVARGEVVVRAFEQAGGHGAQLEIRLTGTVAAGAGAEVTAPGDDGAARVLSGLGVSASAIGAVGKRALVTIRLPLTRRTAGAATRALVEGEMDGFDDLYEVADVEVVVQDVTLEDAESDTDGVVLELDSAVQHTRAVTTEVVRKRPYGPVYSPIDIDQAIDAGRDTG